MCAMSRRADMFVEDESDARYEPPPQGDERTLLAGFLRWHRETLELKCSGLSPEDMANRSVPPSTMSPLGLVRHLAEVERSWFRRVMSGLNVSWPYSSKDDPDGDFDDAIADADVVEDAWSTWRAEVEFADKFIADAPDLDVTGNHRTLGKVSLRWVLIHMIEEYARHNGHADLLRERIDGRLGE
jgi:uncharacterized damage-inducible protein DinB